MTIIIILCVLLLTLGIWCCMVCGKMSDEDIEIMKERQKHADEVIRKLLEKKNGGK